MNGLGYNLFFQTGETADSYSVICDMGQAIPDSDKENWYTNKPIPSLKLELRARLALKDNKPKPMGFIVITKNGEVLKRFSPIGDYIQGIWEGDVFNSWSATDTDIVVYSGRHGRDGLAEFDLLSGNGFYYKSLDKKPAYFLSNCRKIHKKGLPVYDFAFSKKDEK